LGCTRRRPTRLGSRSAARKAFGEDAYPSLWHKAAALCQSLDNNQALVDGNKRLAWLITKVFLTVNGQRLLTTADDGERLMLELVAGHRELGAIADWLSDHCNPMTQPDLPDTPGP
jgi:death-on-curing protein